MQTLCSIIKKNQKNQKRKIKKKKKLIFCKVFFSPLFVVDFSSFCLKLFDLIDKSLIWKVSGDLKV